MVVLKAVVSTVPCLFEGQDDPDLAEIIENFAFDEVPNEPGVNELDDKTRYLAILATLLGSQSLTEFRGIVPAAMIAGLTPVEIKEATYQAVAYLGIARVYPFIAALNEVLRAQEVTLPLPSQSTTTPETRREAGTQAQVDIFGEGMKNFYKSGPDEKRHINRWLAANCFGDYYTRTGLDLKQREMITFCFLAAQGGCEPQLTRSCPRQHVHRQRSTLPHHCGIAVHAVHRLPTHAQRTALCRQGREEHVMKAICA